MTLTPQRLFLEKRLSYVDVDAQRLPADIDDTAAWRRAVALAIASGVRRVHGRSPSYNLSGGVDVAGASGLVISGSGVEATTLTVNGGASAVQAAFYNSGACNDVVIEHMTIKGTIVDDVTGPRRSRTNSGGAGLNSAIIVHGDASPIVANSPVVRNIRLRHLRIVGTNSLPFWFNGVRGYAQAMDVETHLTMDGGWTYCDVAVFDSLRSFKSADNGFSVSRGCKRVIGGSVYVEMCAYYGLWISGFVVTHSTTEAGPTDFSVDTVNVVNAGRGGVQLDDGPRNGRIGSVFVDGVSRGASDAPSDINAVGIRIGSYPSDARQTPQVYAQNIVVESATLLNCARGGIVVSGAIDVHLRNILVVNPGTPFKADGTTAIASSDVSQNFGVACEAGAESTVTRLAVRNLRVIDTRTTPVANYPLYSTGASGTDYSQISYFGTRQVMATDNTIDSYSGNKAFSGNIKFTGGTTAGANAATGTVPGHDINGASGSLRPFRWLTAGIARWSLRTGTQAESGSNAGADMELVSHDDSGAGLVTVLTARRSDGRVTFAGPVRLPVSTTAARPAAATAGGGASIYDSTLGKPVWSDGTNWRDATGTMV